MRYSPWNASNFQSRLSAMSTKRCFKLLLVILVFCSLPSEEQDFALHTPIVILCVLAGVSGFTWIGVHNLALRLANDQIQQDSTGRGMEYS